MFERVRVRGLVVIWVGSSEETRLATGRLFDERATRGRGKGKRECGKARVKIEKISVSVEPTSYTRRRLLGSSQLRTPHTHPTVIPPQQPKHT